VVEGRAQVAGGFAVRGGFYGAIELNAVAFHKGAEFVGFVGGC
jgi:hypothetical protein